MKTFTDRVAVITGGASGLGRAMAMRFASEGMKVVLADIETDALDATHREFRDAGHDAIAMRCDVSESDDVEALADKTLETLSLIHI